MYGWKSFGLQQTEYTSVYYVLFCTLIFADCIVESINISIGHNTDPPGQDTLQILMGECFVVVVVVAIAILCIGGLAVWDIFEWVMFDRIPCLSITMEQPHHV